MIDYSKLDKPAEGSIKPIPTASPSSSSPSVDDKLGYVIPPPAAVSRLGDLTKAKEDVYDIPLIGGIARAADAVGSGIAKVGGWGVSAVVDNAANLLGRVPSNVGDPNASKIDVTQYQRTPADGLRLVQDLHGEKDGNLSSQFLKLGQWQQQNDPGSFTLWQKALDEAQKQTGIGSNAGDIMANYIRESGSFYSDQTPNGVQGLYDVAPELSFTNGGSIGQQFADALGHLMILQRKAERGAATLPANGFLTGDPASSGKTRLADILSKSKKDLTPIELAAATGMREGGWTDLHALNFLVSHGQGYSHNAITELALGFALDPIAAGGTVAADAALIGQKAALYANSARSSSNIMQAYRAGARAIGTTVAATRADPILGPAFKVARTIIDPFSAIGGGPHAAARVDVFASAGVAGTSKAFGEAAVTSAARRATKWGAREAHDSAFGVTSMNFARKWVVNQHISELIGFGNLAARRVVTEDVVDALGRNSAKDAVSRLAGYVQKHKAFWLSSADRDQLAERITKMVKAPLEDVKAGVAEMSDDERALWHANTYSHANAEFIGAKTAASVEEWGNLGKKLDDLVLLNPHQLDLVSARELLDQLTAKGADKVAIWNAAADKYTAIEDLGRATEQASKRTERLVDSLDRMTTDGGMHTALDAREMKNVPQSFKDGFLDSWVDSNGEPMWRLGFKPNAEQATGLIYDSVGEPVVRFEPNIENVADAIPVSSGRSTPISDILGRRLGETAVGAKAARLRDSVDVVLQAATDSVSGERLATSMEQSFRSQMREAGFADSLARDVFKVSRKAAQDTNVTLAGLTPTEFWKAAESELSGIVDEAIAKREIFSMLAKSAGGDMRLMGISSGMTQRIRAAAIARGLDPDNYLGQVTVKFYQTARYALNPLFFLQAVTDAPFFNMMRGIMPVGGGVLKEGDALFETAQITKAIGRTSMARDLSMDYAERTALIGWQEAVRDRIGGMPGTKEGITQSIKDGIGRMEINNQLAFVNSKMGDAVFDALETTRTALAEKVAAGGTEFQRELDQLPMLEDIRAQAGEFYGRVATNEEAGRWYLSEMIEDSRLEVRTKDGLLNYQAVNAKGAYHVPMDLGELKPLDLDYLATAVKWPNVKDAAGLRSAVSMTGEHTIGDLRDAMKALGMHKDQIKRATNALTFDYRSYFDGLRSSLGMTKLEMQGIEDMVAKQARAAGMGARDYLTQVLPMTATDGLDGHMALTLKVMRAAKKGEAGIDDMSKLVTNNLHPSMKNTLLDYFEHAATGKQGLIEKAMAAGDTATAQGLNSTIEDLRGGWGPKAVDDFRDLVIRRASGETARTFPAVPGHATAKMIPTDLLDQFMEIDRAAVPVGENIVDRDLSSLVEDIRKNGLKDPVTIEYDASSGTALLTDGNHRLAAARELGIKDIPVDIQPAKRLPSESNLTKAPAGFKPVGNSPLFSQAINEPEVERAARYFAKFIQDNPNLSAGAILKDIVANVPVEGASAHNFTQALLMHSFSDSVRLAEKDAIRLAQIQTERTVLERSLNHPFFGVYPTSYMWGKVIPETFKFMAYNPFGIKTALGAEAYLKVKQTVDMQSQYDDTMGALWKKFGKSAVIGLMSYISPSMPWEDMRGNLPPWLRALSKDFDISKATQDEFDTISPERWVKRFLEAGKEVGDVIRPGISIGDQEAAQLNDISTQATPPPTAPAGPSPITGPIKGTGLAPILADDLRELQRVLGQR